MAKLKDLINSELMLKTNSDLENTNLAIQKKDLSESLNGSEVIISDFNDLLKKCLKKLFLLITPKLRA